jgi:hypothetical protein
MQDNRTTVLTDTQTSIPQERLDATRSALSHGIAQPFARLSPLGRVWLGLALIDFVVP